MSEAHICSTDARRVDPATTDLRCKYHGCSNVASWYVPMIAGGMCEEHSDHLRQRYERPAKPRRSRR